MVDGLGTAIATQRLSGRKPALSKPCSTRGAMVAGFRRTQLRPRTMARPDDSVGHVWPFRRTKKPKPLLVTRNEWSVDLEFGILDAAEHDGWATLGAVAQHVRCTGVAAESAAGLTMVSLALDGDPSRVLEEPVKIKLFHDLWLAQPQRDEDDETLALEAEASYFEWYLNIDPERRTVELREREKEDEYR